MTPCLNTILGQLELSREEWFCEFILSLMTVGIPALLLFAVFGQIRIARRAKVAGALLLKVRPPRWLIVGCAAAAILTVVPLALLLRRVLSPSNRFDAELEFLFWELLLPIAAPLVAMTLIGLLVILRRLHPYLELREHGVCHGRRFMPWNRVSFAYWLRRRDGLRLEFVNHCGLYYVRKGDIPAIDALLREHIEVANEADAQDSGLASRPRLSSVDRQFHLRTLLLGVVFAALVFSVLATRLERIRRNQQIGMRLEQAGVRVDAMRGRIWGLDFSACNPKTRDEDLAAVDELGDLLFLTLDSTDISDVGLMHMASLKNLNSLSLMKTRITDAGVAHIAGLRNLRTLMLNGTDITDSGLEHLTELTELRYLFLSDTQMDGSGLQSLDKLTKLEMLCLSNSLVDDNALVHLAKLNGLTSLSLRKTRITDAGLQHLAALTNLVSLDLSDTKITDQALANLEGMKHLESLGLSGAGLTKESVETLQKALPQTKIDFTPPAAANPL
jgi:hypothetical protein